MQQMQGGALGIVFKIFAIILAFSLGVAVGGQPIIGFQKKKKKKYLKDFIVLINQEIEIKKDMD